ncbi:unnamed protein product [Arabis nemorensis]|uniref:Uncharacterized protein n=1 Tax=Arabis nemorensis TaxID=586526 RepID=A0A565AYQ4_9BRAS|nr:unnamed protein product [Arabis nemorensis]
MAHLVKKTQHEPSSLVDLGDDEKMRESGFVIPQNITKHSSLTRRLEAAANRHGIKAGRHWDGVHRSNGYENYMLNKRNKNKATEREAYLWSVSDM